MSHFFLAPLHSPEMSCSSSLGEWRDIRGHPLAQLHRRLCVSHSQGTGMNQLMCKVHDKHGAGLQARLRVCVYFVTLRNGLRYVMWNGTMREWRRQTR